MDGYRITLVDGLGRELAQMETEAEGLRPALVEFGRRLGHLDRPDAVAAHVELLPPFVCLVDESAGLAEEIVPQSIRADLYETNERGLTYELGGTVCPEWEDGQDEPSTEQED